MSDFEFETDESLNPRRRVKLFSTIAISLTTFICGPFAGVYMLSRNFKGLGNNHAARNTMIIGMIASALFIIGFFILPDNITSKIPGSLISLVFAGIITAFTYSRQGNDLSEHKRKNFPFFKWRVLGVGLISILVTLILGLSAYMVADSMRDPEPQTEEFKGIDVNETDPSKIIDQLKKAQGF